jgi:hypothetical protein
MRLEPGGRAVPGVRSLYCLSGWVRDVEAVSGKRAQPPYPLAQYGSMTPLFEEANLPDETVGSLGALGSDGNLWVTLPDGGTPVDATLNAPRNFYAYSLSSQEYKLTLTASTNGTAIDLSTNRPEFCVGQTVYLSANWNPSLPGGTQRSAMPWINDGTLWILGGNFVDNYYYQALYPSGSLIYTNDPNYLTNEAALVWWTSGDYASPPAYTAFFHEVLTFANGQTVNIGASGKIKMFRPSVNFTLESAGPVVLTPDDANLLGFAAQLSSGDIKFHAAVTSTDFSGDLNWVQLIKRLVAGNGLYSQNTLGNYWLDNVPFYNTGVGEDGNKFVGPGIVATNNFYDDPMVECIPINTSINDSFKTYLVFHPPGDGIWVTLGRVDWGWSGFASDVNMGSDLLWELDSCSLTLPHYTDTDEFPEYPDVLLNSGNPDQ